MINEEQVRMCNVFALQITPLYLYKAGHMQCGDFISGFGKITAEDIEKGRVMVGAGAVLELLTKKMRHKWADEEYKIRNGSSYGGYSKRMPAELRTTLSDMRWTFGKSTIGSKLYSTVILSNSLIALREDYEWDSDSVVETAQTAMSMLEMKEG